MDYESRAEEKEQSKSDCEISEQDAEIICAFIASYEAKRKGGRK